MNQNEMSQVVQEVRLAFERTVAANITDEDNLGRQNANRSRRFIMETTRALRGMFAGAGYADRMVGVLSKGVESDVRGLTIRQELLYDVHAFEYDLVPSPTNGVDLCILKGSLIQMESELANDTKEIVTDFGKLVCGRADMKIMVMPRVQNEFELTMNLMRGIALNIPEPLFLILVPYPTDWHSGSKVAMEGAHAFRFSMTDGGGLWEMAGVGN